MFSPFCIFFHFCGATLLRMQPGVQVIVFSGCFLVVWIHDKASDGYDFCISICFCRKGEHGRVLRMDQLNRDDMREVNEWQNVQNKKTQSTREEFETPSIQDSKSVSTTELLQFHLSCFRCNICHVILKERDGKRTLGIITSLI